jgi:beta-lactamase regulating signal transducer with metallopeptidase domain
MGALIQFGLANAGAAAVLAIGVAIVTRVWRNPHLAHALWLIVLLRLVAPPLFQIPLHSPDWLARRSPAIQPGTARDGERSVPRPVVNQRETPDLTHAADLTFAARNAAPDTSVRSSVRRLEPVTPTLAPSTAASSLPSVPSTAPPLHLTDVFAAIWIIGTFLYVAVTAVRVRQFSRAVRRSQSPPPICLQDEIFDIAERIGLRRAPRLMVIEGALPPMIWSGWRPTLLMPRAIVESIVPAQRRLLLLHELLHLRRRDHLVRWFAVAVLALYWWNPAAWWAVRRLQNAEEECCDADVLSFDPHQFEIYGEALLAVCEFVSCGSLPAAAVSVGVERKNHLKWRMTMILKGSGWPKRTKTRLAAMIGCGVIALGVSLTNAAAQVELAPEASIATKAKPEAAEHKSAKPTIAVAQPAPVTADSTKRADTPQPSKPAPSIIAPPSPRRRPAFSHYAPLEVLPNDDETQKIVKERYNASLRSLKLHQYQYDVNQRTPLGNMLAAARSLLEAKLALAQKPEDQVRTRQDYLEFITACWREARARLDIGGAVGFSPLDEAQALEALFDAKLKLAQPRPPETDKALETARAVWPALGGAAELQSPAVTSGSVTGPTAANARPAMLTAKPLEPAVGDDELHKLLKDRYNSALKSLQGHYERSTVDNNMPITIVIVAAHTLLEAELALATAKETVGIYERYLEFMKYFDNLAEGRRKSGSVGLDEFNAVHAARLEAEIKLLQARALASTNPRADINAGVISHLALQSLETRIQIAEAEVTAARAAVEQSYAELKRALANLKYRQLQFDRLQTLRKQNSVAQDAVDEATRARDETAASVDAAKASIQAAIAQVAIKNGQLQQARFEVDNAKAFGAK